MTTNAVRRRMTTEQLERSRREVRFRNGHARAFVAGTTLGGIVVLGVVDGKSGGRMANVAYTPGEALRYAAAIARRAVSAWLEAHGA